jgi:adenine-specific DNA-methyltransferase
LFDIDNIFDTVKPVDLIKRLLFHTTNKSALVLDFFAGSGTTAHAVEQLNSEDGCNRKWILCTIPEITPSPSEARNAGFNTIDEISRERIRRAGQKILEKIEAQEAENSNEGTLLDPRMFAGTDGGDAGTEIVDKADNNNDVRKWNKDIGFKHFRVVTPEANTIDRIAEFDPEIDAIIADDMLSEFADKASNASGCDTIVTTYLLDDGYELTQKPDEIEIAGYKAYYIADSVLYLINQGWGADQTKELLNLVGTNKINLNTIVLYGYSFTFESLRELCQAITRKVSEHREEVLIWAKT